MPSMLEFIFLGMLQGFTEPLPISSSGHLIIAQELMGIEIPGMSFEAFINFGSTLAIIAYFWKDLWLLVAGFFGFFKSKGKKYKKEWDFIVKIIISTIPICFVGLLVLLFGQGIDIQIQGVGLALFITGSALLLVTRLNGSKNITSITYKDALIIGLFQSIAVVPGLSRSGMTLVGCLLIGLNTRDSFKYTFIMFIPASIGGLFLSLLSISSDPLLQSYLSGYIVAFICAGICTWLGLKLLKNIMIAQKLKYFSFYCYGVSLFILLYTIF